MKQPAWRTERRKVATLLPADYNPRTMSEKERSDLRQSITEYGEVEPVVINMNGTLIGGHQRLKIYKDLEIDEIDVRIPDRQLTLEEEMKLNIRLNKNVGQWDYQKLKEFGEDLLLDTGWSDEELRVAFGLGEAAGKNIDEERMMVLTILPPESPQIKERASILFRDIAEYRKVKDAIQRGKLTTKELLKLID